MYVPVPQYKMLKQGREPGQSYLDMHCLVCETTVLMLFRPIRLYPFNCETVTF